MDPLAVIAIRAGYAYLFILAVSAIIRSIRYSFRVHVLRKEEGLQVHPLLRVVAALILYLSIIQISQCIELFFAPLSGGWWIPFICKHGALVIYHVALSLLTFVIGFKSCVRSQYGTC